MEITCEKCEGTFQIPDATIQKIPAGKVATLTCPKCKEKITLKPEELQNRSDKETEGAGFMFDEQEEDEIYSQPREDYDASEKPFDFIEEEGNTALICDKNPEVRKKIAKVLDYMEYHVTESESAWDAIKKMRYHHYDLVIVNELFDTKEVDKNGVLIYVERLTMETRRHMYVAMLSDRVRTMDQMTAFYRSVNIIINTRDLDEFERIIRRGITDNEFFYRTYFEVAKKLGKL